MNSASSWSPEGAVRAPCNGKVIAMQSAAGAVIRSVQVEAGPQVAARQIGR